MRGTGSDREGGDRLRLRIGFQVWGQHVSWDELMHAGTVIDEMGFDGLWSNDHLLPVVGSATGMVEAESGPVWDAWMTLMGWAARTERVTLGCMVSSVSYRHPGLLVRMATAIDHASGGRAILGIGAGWNETEHRAFGFAYPSLKERLDRLDEAAMICRQLVDGHVAEFDGQWYHVHGARNEPAPYAGRLPLLIGGSGERRTLPIVARDADIWNGEGDPGSYRRKSQRLDVLCREAGRPPDAVKRTVGLPPPLIREDRQRAVAELARVLEHHGLERSEALATAASSSLAGPAGQIAQRLADYREAGAEEIVFDWPLPSDGPTLEALATEIAALS